MSAFLLVSCSGMRKKSMVLNNLDPFQSYSIERLSLDEDSKLKNFPNSLVLCYKGETQKGLEALKKEFFHQENSPKYWNRVGSCYSFVKDYAKARFYFNVGLSIDANDVELLHNLALVSLKYGNWQETLTTLIDLSRRYPQYLLVKFNVATLYYEYQSPELALEYLSQVKKMIPNDPLVNLYRMRSFMSLGKWEEAAKEFSDIPKNYQQKQDYANHYGLVLLKLGKYNESKIILEQAKKGGRDKAEVSFKDQLLFDLQNAQNDKFKKSKNQQQQLKQNEVLDRDALKEKGKS